MVNDCGFTHRFEFKHQFEDSLTVPSRIPAAFCLTQPDTMLINGALKARGAHVRKFVSLILVTKRTAAGG
jgi:hypothetical protein